MVMLVRSYFCLTIVFTLLLVISFQTTQTETVLAPCFESGVPIQENDEPIDVGLAASPTVCDWNNDGRLDLIIGNYDGYVSYYQNIGTNTTPYMDTGKRIQAEGVDINVVASAAPVVVDWNNDGKKDLIIGNTVGYGYEGYILYFENQGTDESPEFGESIRLRAQGGDINGKGFVRPHVVDWNNDGKKDLIFGNGPDGKIFLFINEYTDANPGFGSSVLVEANGEPIDIGDYAAPYVIDWNQDGKKDLFVGVGEGQVYYYENKNTNENPVFKMSIPVQAGGTELRGDTISVPWIEDWNQDGKKDLIIGDYQGNVLFFLYRGNCEITLDTKPTSTPSFTIVIFVVAITLIAAFKKKKTKEPEN